MKRRKPIHTVSQRHLRRLAQDSDLNSLSENRSRPNPNVPIRSWHDNVLPTSMLNVHVVIAFATVPLESPDKFIVFVICAYNELSKPANSNNFLNDLSPKLRSCHSQESIYRAKS